MASYRGHLAFGGITAAAGVAAISAFTDISDTGMLTTLFLLIIGGAFLPDIDSDSSLPFYLVYGGFCLAVTTVVVKAVLLETGDTRTRILVPLAALAFLWFVLGGIIKSMTHHRGMIHSLPALVIAALATVLVAARFEFVPAHMILFGLAVGVGYLSHLVLDEIYAFVDFHGLPFIPNKAFGSALKLWSSSKAASIACYLLLFILAYLTGSAIELVLGHFFV